MIPSSQAIDEALDVLGWLTDEEIAITRAAVARVVERAKARKQAGAPSHGSGSTPIAWTPVEIALMFVLWTTSTEYLEERI